uniref:Uncharacterized protein n=1 Tax=Panagrolaimus sp. JU765 TaxID=591449 RepID=A0AC34RJ81_9BILA
MTDFCKFFSYRRSFLAQQAERIIGFEEKCDFILHGFVADHERRLFINQMNYSLLSSFQFSDLEVKGIKYFVPAENANSDDFAGKELE